MIGGVQGRWPGSHFTISIELCLFKCSWSSSWLCHLVELAYPGHVRMKQCTGSSGVLGRLSRKRKHFKPDHFVLPKKFLGNSVYSQSVSHL